MAKTLLKTQWTMAEDRRLMKLAASGESIEAIATKMRRYPASVMRKAVRLGISLKAKK
jgi:hypothetical protein